MGLRTVDSRLYIAAKDRSDDDKIKGDHDNGNLNAQYLALGALLFTFISNQWARQSIYYLCDFSADATSFKHINIGELFMYVCIHMYYMNQQPLPNYQ